MAANCNSALMLGVNQDSKKAAKTTETKDDSTVLLLVESNACVT